MWESVGGDVAEGRSGEEIGSIQERGEILWLEDVGGSGGGCYGCVVAGFLGGIVGVLGNHISIDGVFLDLHHSIIALIITGLSPLLNVIDSNTEQDHL